MAVLLTVREEAGGGGCRAFLARRQEWFGDVAACLVLDRRGEGDVVTRIGAPARSQSHISGTITILSGRPAPRRAPEEFPALPIADAVLQDCFTPARTRGW